MARTARTGNVTEVDNQIRKKQEKLYSLKDQYDAVADEIQELLKKKEEMQKAEILSAYEQSGRTFEEVMEFLKTAPPRTSAQLTEKRKGRPKKIAE